MSSTVLSKVFLGIYELANKSGILKTSPAQKLFIECYFLYKRFLEDSITGLLRKHPELAEAGDVFDVGANIGYSSILFSRYVSPGRKIYAFEPDLKNLSTFEDLIRKKNLCHVITPIRAAVGEKSGEVKLRLNDRHHADHRVVTDSFEKMISGEDRVETVSLISIDDFRQSCDLRAPISLIKIDVQGFEYGVCQGMIQTLNQFPEAAIIFEHSPASAVEMGFPAQAVPEFFLNRGYALLLVAPNGSVKSVSRVELAEYSGAPYVDILATRFPERFTQVG